MSLTGIAVDDPRPLTARELIFNAGDAGAPASDMLVLLYGNQTSDGSETADSSVSLTPIDDLADCLAKYGKRSEIQQLYRKYTLVDKTARIYVAPVAEGGGAAAATVTFTFAAGAATAQTEIVIEFGGETEYVTVLVGDTAIIQAAAVAAKINAASNGCWPFSAAVGANPNEHIVTVTAANLGPRHGANLTSLRITYKKSTTTTCTKAAVTAGTTEDDFTSAYASAALGTFAIQVNPKTATSSVTATDNGVGEGIDYIKGASLPAVGKEQWMFFGLVGTQSQQATTCQSSGANCVWAHFIWSEASPWTAGMLAAHHAAIFRVNYMAHPSENLNGYSSDRGTYAVPAQYSKADWPTQAEIIACLNSGASPVEMDSQGRPKLTRHVSSKCLDGTAPDFRARSGHTAFAVRYAWLLVESRYRTRVKQRGIADDPIQGQKPKPNTTYPGGVRAMLASVVDELTSAKPLGLFDGPILDPSPGAVAAMKASILVTKFAAGFQADLEWKVLEHLNKGLFKARETSPNI